MIWSTTRPRRALSIKPGAPAKSTVLHRMKLRGTVLQMPPLATVLPDLQAIALVEAWIAEDLKPK